MDYENEHYEDQLEEWFAIYDDYKYKPKITFDGLENKLHPSQQVGAIMFLASKLKDKAERFFLHGEHDTLYIGSGFDTFEEFTEEDVKTAVAYGISISDVDGGFQMYASM